MAIDPSSPVPHAMNDGGIVSSSATTATKADASLGATEVAYKPTSGGRDHADAKPVVDSVKAAGAETSEQAKTIGSNANQLVKDGVAKLNAQAGDRARGLVEDGKDRASAALEQLAQMLHEAAASVDDKIGSQYGDYARSAADQVNGFADRVRAKDPDELFSEARALISQSPGAAIGIFAALGFGIARLAQSGLAASPAERA